MPMLVLMHVGVLVLVLMGVLVLVRTRVLVLVRMRVLVVPMSVTHGSNPAGPGARPESPDAPRAVRRHAGRTRRQVRLPAQHTVCYSEPRPGWRNRYTQGT